VERPSSLHLERCLTTHQIPSPGSFSIFNQANCGSPEEPAYDNGSFIDRERARHIPGHTFGHQLSVDYLRMEVGRRKIISCEP